jgi:hypothetical protein
VVEVKISNKEKKLLLRLLQAEYERWKYDTRSYVRPPLIEKILELEEYKVKPDTDKILGKVLDMLDGVTNLRVAMDTRRMRIQEVYELMGKIHNETTI